jgi:glycosyltransferase involved in cell wall biosynthesis
MDISVVVASYNASHTIADCLEGLAAQKTRRCFEVIVADSSTDRTPQIIARDFPWVRLLHFPKRLYPGMARNMGIEAAKGAVIAFIDADCVPAPDWVERIARAHESARSVVGGGMVCSRDDSLIQLAYFFGEFSQWLPRQPARWIKDQPTANISYKRKLFEKRGGFNDQDYCSDTDFNFGLIEQGHGIWFDPAILVRHQSPAGLGHVLRHQIIHGRAFGRWRMKRRHWPLLRRVLYAAFWPVVAFKLGIQKTAQAASYKKYRKLVFKCWPLFWAVIVCWTWGETLAYLHKPDAD